jgi:hypothetical protein
MASDLKDATEIHAEPRWPVALGILIVLALLILLPNRVRIFPPWTLYVMGVIMFACLGGAAKNFQSTTWARVERWMTFGFVAIAGAASLAMLRELIYDMIRRSNAVDGLHLLTSSIAIWAMNVMMFTLLYWQLDRGGPYGRSIAHRHRDWIFPQDQASAEDLPPDWRPQFVDYLFLGFSTATAFSTTDALPLTGRAKLAMMAESTISLVTLVVVAARAINVLGT